MDNATIHHMSQVTHTYTIETVAQAKLVFLPLYSPDATSRVEGGRKDQIECGCTGIQNSNKS